MDTTVNVNLNAEEWSEERLVRACVRRERWAQRALYETHYGRLMGVCLRYAREESEAMDILHEGFIKIFKHIRKYEMGTSLGAWMRRIMVNTAIDFYRRNVRRRTDDLDDAYSVSSDDPDAISRMTTQEILAAVQQLTPAYRTVFNLYVVEGYSHKEIGMLMGITESTSRSNLVKARNRLKELLTRE